MSKTKTKNKAFAIILTLLIVLVLAAGGVYHHFIKDKTPDTPDDNPPITTPSDDEASDYTLIFVADGKPIAILTSDDEGNFTEPEVPEKLGYSGEWEAYELDGDKTINAVYTPIEYTITYHTYFIESEFYDIEEEGMLDADFVLDGDWYVSFTSELPHSYTIEDDDIVISPEYREASFPKRNNRTYSVLYFYADTDIASSLPNPFTIPSGSTGNLDLYILLEYI